jgi:hypothetical protein
MKIRRIRGPGRTAGEMVAGAMLAAAVGTVATVAAASGTVTATAAAGAFMAVSLLTGAIGRVVA